MQNIHETPTSQNAPSYDCVLSENMSLKEELVEARNQIIRLEHENRVMRRKINQFEGNEKPMGTSVDTKRVYQQKESAKYPSLQTPDEANQELDQQQQQNCPPDRPFEQNQSKCFREINPKNSHADRIIPKQHHWPQLHSPLPPAHQHPNFKQLFDPYSKKLSINLQFLPQTQLNELFEYNWDFVEEMVLDGNLITEVLTRKISTEMYWPNLKKLSMCYCETTQFDNVSNFPKLEFLDLRRNPIDQKSRKFLQECITLRPKCVFEFDYEI